MKAMSCLLSVLAVLSAAADFRPPSVPIVSCDPYFSIWSPSDCPTDSDTEIWFGARQPIRVAVELDGVRYRLMGRKSSAAESVRDADAPALRCVDCRVEALTTTYRFASGTVAVELSFLTPKLADELDVFSRPVTYATVKTTGAKDVRVFAEIGPELATNDDKAAMVTNRTMIAGCAAVSIARAEQKPLAEGGDRVRCDWGSAWLVNPEAEGPEVHFLLAYDDVETLKFLDRTVQAWWKRDGKPFEEMLAEAEADYGRLQERARRFDERFASEMRRVGGEKYLDLAALSYRQSFAACKLVAGPDGQPLYFSKENTSNGCIGTVDVFYPQLPLLLLASPTLTRATLEPILLYATSGRWPFKYAPHDVGVWPLANGQVYNFGPHAKTKSGELKSDATRMPVEECGNMLIALCALAEAEGNAEFPARYWETLTDWAAYLETFGFDPGNQLCTDDFAGHLAHNANLSIKSILAFASYARLAERLGKAATAEKYRRLAEASVTKWMAAAEGGAAGGYRLAFDQPDSWSQKYNLVWDRVLGLNLFPKTVAEREMAAYRRLAQPFGLPLDSRKDYTKLDWEFWTAALTGERKDLDFITDLVWRYANETPDRHPLPDWYWANNARVRGFWGRPVIGGVFMPALAARAGAAPTTKVKVDFTVEMGPVKPVNGVGQPPLIGGPGNYHMMHYLKEAGIPYSRLHDVGGAYGQMRYVDVPNIFRDFDADEEDPANYDFAYTDDLLKALVANNVEPFVRLGVTIENAVERGFPGYRCDPPKDYAKWARICEHIIAHYTERWANGFLWNIAYWEIWNEPDNNPIVEKNPLFRAPWSEFLKFYGTVAPYLKDRFPRLKIGGYASCGFYAGVGAGQVKAANSSPRLEHFVTCAEEFLAAAKENDWPLDFFSYHSYSAPAEALRQVAYADALLNRYGFTADKTERIFNEWLPYVGHENLGTALQAAGIAAELIGLQNGPCDLACIYDARCGIGNYSPLFNPMTYKPHKSYFAFTAFNELRKCGRAVKVETTESTKGFYVTAATGDCASAVLLANDSDVAIPLACDFGGRTPREVRLTDAERTDAVVPMPAVLPPHAFAVVLFDGAPDETAEIQRRIDEAFRAGGGKVSIAPGVHHIGGLRLRSNVELHLEANAVLKANRDPEAYVDVMRKDAVEPVPEAFFTQPNAPFEKVKPSKTNTPGSRWNNAIIRLYRAKNAAITGEPGSVIDGGNAFDLQGEEGYRGFHGISAFSCENLTLKGYTLRRSGNWGHRIVDSRQVRVVGVTVKGGHDGMDYHGCRGVEIVGCTIHSGDDCLAGILNEGVHVRDCDLSSSCSIVRMGGNGLVFEDCRAHGPCEWAWRYEYPPDARRAGVDRVPGYRRYNTLSFFTHFGSSLDAHPGDAVFRNCTVTDVGKLLHFNRSGNEIWQRGPGLGHVVFENLQVTGLREPSIAYGTPEHPVTIKLKDCELSFVEPVEALVRGANVEAFKLSGVKIDGVEAPFYRQWESRKPSFEIDGYEGPKPAATPADEEFVCSPI